MKIKDRLSENRVNISFEVFPPKTDAGYGKVLEATEEIAALKPSFISVTYGAGGGTSKNTVKIASHIQNDLGVASLAHLTCASSTKEEVRQVIEQLKEQGIQNILALRGDIPKDGAFPIPNHYKYASELIADIKSQGDFCIGAACYPEGHVESEFFDNSILYNFLYRIREKGITVPVLPGIMPVTNGKQIARICELSGTILPERFRAIVDRFGDDPKAMQQAGIAYATDQIIDLIANGIQNIHIYSMNKPEIAAAIMTNLSEIIK